MKEHTLLLELLTPRDELPSLDPPTWDRVLVQARNAGVLARLGARLERSDGWGLLPDKARTLMRAELAVSTENQRALRWEVGRIQRALDELGVDLVLLKGAAYVFAELPAAEGRIASDVDILVPKSRLDEVERALLHRGWEAMKLDAYDQRYYRTWMHELPPLCHRDRDVVVDVHHNILPETGRLHPEPAALIAASRHVDGSGVKVLAPEDMVLHSAAHLFQDGDLDGGLRDLVDLDSLFRDFGEDAGFEERLHERAKAMDLERPLFYALRYCQRWLGTPISTDALERPSRIALSAMDGLTDHALEPDDWEPPSMRKRIVRWILYVRSHWLRMPPLLLARHLLIKAWSRARPREG